MTGMRPAPVPACPCGAGARYEDCCGRYHAGESAPDAATLMRARYSAYVMGRADFLRATWHPAHCPETLDLDEAPKPQWLGLTLLGSAQTDARHATVTFVARFKRNGRARRLHEISEFVQTPAGWLYVKGVFPDET